MNDKMGEIVMKKTIRMECKDLEWLYVPNVMYHEYEETMYIDKDTPLPPILLLHGAEDRQVSVRQSRYLYDLLMASGKDVVYWELEGVGHGGAVFWSDTVLDIICEFLRRENSSVEKSTQTP